MKNILAWARITVPLLIGIALVSRAMTESHNLLDLDACYNKGQYQESVTVWDGEIANSPKDARLYERRGRSYLRLAQYDRALADFDQAIKLDAAADCGMEKELTTKQYLGKIHAERAEAYEALNKKDLAQKDRAEALALGYSAEAQKQK